MATDEDSTQLPGSNGVELPATLTLFGYPPASFRLKARRRSLAWRGGWAAAFGGGGLLAAPLVGVVPPHAPWVVGSLGLGGFLALRRWRERFAVLEGEGVCPRCGGEIRLRPGSALRAGMSVPCPGCGHESRLTVDLTPTAGGT